MSATTNKLCQHRLMSVPKLIQVYEYFSCGQTKVPDSKSSLGAVRKLIEPGCHRRFGIYCPIIPVVISV